MIDPKEKTRREKAWRNAYGSTRVEYPNFELSPYIQVLVDKWVDGKITAKELREKVVARAKRQINKNKE